MAGAAEVKTPNNKAISDNIVMQMILDRMDRTEDVLERVAESQSNTNTKFTTFLEKFSHTEGRADEQERVTKNHERRIDVIEKTNIRFIAYIVSGVLIVTTLTGIGSWWYLNVYKPQQSSAITTKSAIESIDNLNMTNQKILDALSGD